jgi:PAS domain-containing protein
MPIETVKAESGDLLRRLEEAEETMRAIREGAVDAFMVEDPEGSRVYTLEGADRPYRVPIEQMQQGAAVLTADGAISYSNLSLARLLKVPLEQLIGAPFHRFVVASEQAPIKQCCARAKIEAAAGRSACSGVTAHFCQSTLHSARY